jgi:hypothetical protein
MISAEKAEEQPPTRTVGTANKRVLPRKRKAKSGGISLAIGASRFAATEGRIINATTAVAAAAAVDASSPATVATTTTNATAAAPDSSTAATEPVIPPPAAGDGPSLSSYCSKFRSKRKGKKAAVTPTVAKEVPETDAQANANSQISAGPMVQIINGEIVIQESSILVAGFGTAGSAMQDEEMQVVEEEAQLAVVGASYNSFVTRRAPQHWTVEDTRLFYDALRQVGVDFSSMEAYFGDKRTRKQLKRKYQIEMTKNPLLIEKALDPTSQKEIGTFVLVRPISA